MESFQRVRIAKKTEDDIIVIQSRSILPTDPSYSTDALHIWAEIAPIDDYNQRKLDQLPGSVYIS